MAYEYACREKTFAINSFKYSVCGALLGILDPRLNPFASEYVPPCVPIAATSGPIILITMSVRCHPFYKQNYPFLFAAASDAYFFIHLRLPCNFRRFQRPEDGYRNIIAMIKIPTLLFARLNLCS